VSCKFGPLCALLALEETQPSLRIPIGAVDGSLSGWRAARISSANFVVPQCRAAGTRMLAQGLRSALACRLSQTRLGPLGRCLGQWTLADGMRGLGRIYL